MSDFKILLRRDPGYELRLTLRFSVDNGLGVLSLARKGRGDPPPAGAGEESDVEIDAVRGGRFVHVASDGGRRQSYALSRIDVEKLARLPDSEWVELEAITEFGFRYIVLPENLPAASPAVKIQVAAVAVRASEPEPGAAAAQAAASSPAAGMVDPSGLRGRTLTGARGLPRPNPVAAAPPADDADDDVEEIRSAPPQSRALGRPEPVASVSSALPASRPAEPTEPGGLPARPVAMESSLARATLQGLPRELAVAKLQEEMTKVQQLHDRIAELERRLQSSQSRERDLLEVLSRWQSRDA